MAKKLNSKLSEKVNTTLKQIITINTHDKTQAAYNIMISNDITSLPVVENDKIISVISLSDIKLFAKTPLPYMEIRRLLNSDVLTFIEESRKFVALKSGGGYHESKEHIS